MDRGKTIVKSDLSSESSDPVRAAAVAAGAWIATASDAATLFKAAQAKNAAHLISTGSIKSSAPGCAPPLSETCPGTCHISSGLPIMQFCGRATGLGKASVVSQPTSSSPALPSPSLECTGEDTSTTEGMKNSGQDVAQESQVPGGRGFISVNKLNEKCEVDAGSQIGEGVLGCQHAVASSSNASTGLETIEGNLMHVDCNNAEDTDTRDVNETLVVLAKEGENHLEVLSEEDTHRLHQSLHQISCINHGTKSTSTKSARISNLP